MKSNKFGQCYLVPLGHMLRDSKEEISSKILYIQFIKKLKIKCNAHIPINYFYIWIIKGTS